MARPNSKYFASIITKLIAEKRKEQIVIDESFKMRLRSDLLTRAAGADVKSERPDFADFIRRWRYAFAVVPSALVVMIVAAQFLNMPVTVPSEQVVPVPAQETEEKVSLPEQTSLAEEETEVTGAETEALDIDELPVVSVDGATKKLKTFPGAMVLPQVLKTDTVSDAQLLTAQQPQSEAEDSAEEPDLPAPVPAQQMVLPTFLDKAPSTTTSHREVKKQKEQPTEITAADEQKEPEQSLGIQFVEGPDIQQPVQQPSSQQPSQQTGPTSAQPATTVPYPTQTGPTSAPTAPSTATEEQKATAGTQTNVPALPLLQEPVQPLTASPQRINATGGRIIQPLGTAGTGLVLDVDYDVLLSFTQRQKLESTVIPSLVGQKQALSVRVYKNETNIIGIKIVFADGSTMTSFYTYNSSTGVFDNVQYVTNYYFDDGLSYITHLEY